jgi:hypothetical protein
MSDTKAYIQKLIENDLGNARDNIARAEMQLKRMPFDHDTRDALERYRKWESEAQTALESQSKQA